MSTLVLIQACMASKNVAVNKEKKKEEEKTLNKNLLHDVGLKYQLQSAADCFGSLNYGLVHCFSLAPLPL